MSAGQSVGQLIEDAGSDDLAGAANVLVLAGSLDDAARESYYETLLPDDPSTTDLLAVEYRRTPEQCLDEWHRYMEEAPRRYGIITVDESPGSRPAGDAEQGGVARVDSPADLTGVVIRVGDYFDTHGGTDTVITFDSLTVLLQYVDLERAFRFLHAVASRVRRQDAVAHYHVDPGAHDDEVLATLASVFDAVARFDDGEWETRSR